MKHFFYAFFIVTLSLLASACQRMAEQDSPVHRTTHTITATLEGKTDTKTVLSEPDENGIYYPYWSVGDAVAVYVDGINKPDTYSLVSGAGTGKGSFSGTLFGSRLVALYPAADKTEEGLKDNLLTFELPATQKYVMGSFGKDAFPMLAVSTSSDLSFKNLCSVLKVSMTGRETIKSIKFISNDSWMSVSGKAIVRTDFSSEPLLEMADDGSPEVILECGSVELDPTVPTDFFLVIPPGTYHGGFTIEIKTYNGQVTRSTTKDITFGRSQFRAIPPFECVGSGEVDLDVVPYNQIWYVTNGDYILGFPEEGLFNVPIISNTYENGKGVITFAGPVTEIKSYAFSNGGLKEIHLPDCVTTIGECAFGFSSLSSFRTPEQLSSLDMNPFRGCNLLSQFYGKWASEDGRYIVLDDGVLATCAPGAMRETEVVPEGIKSLDKYAFMYNNITRRVILPEGVTSIENACFQSCTVLETVSLPASLDKLGGNIFLDCPNLKKFEGNCELIWDDGVILVDSSGMVILFVGKDIEEYSVPEGVTCLGSSSFVGLPNLRSLTFPSTLNELWSNWISDCPKLEFFYGPQTTDDHHCLVFYGDYLVAATPVCPADYVIPTDAGIEAIFLSVFDNNKTIEHLTIPEEVYFIYGQAFSNMTNLKSVRLSAALNDFGFNNFTNDEALESIYVRSFTPPTYTEDSFCFAGHDGLKVYVPKGFEKLYETASGWSAYSQYLEGYEYEDLEDPDYYISSDYSHDGEVVTLQTASEGDGIDLVLLGDGYSDRQIADGTYDAAMQKMMDAFFGEEPYTTYRNLFNVYAITVVSATEGYDHGGQALGSWFGGGTQVGGNDGKCMDYAQKVVPEAKMNNALIVVAMNRDYYAGTCYMYYPSSGDYGEGTSVAYFPTSSNEDTYIGLVRHEAGGHGFAKLADEYAYDSPITDEDKSALEANMVYGWSKNVDFTSDPEKVKWAKFLKDERYQYDGLGVFEGGATYATGVWRPTENSMMRYNDSPFNAPSREAIWYRIHKLAYGDNWEYNYEDFVAYDAKNRKTAAATKMASPNNYVERRMEPTHPPVVVHQTWKEAMQKAKARKPAPQQNAAPAPRNPVNTPVKTSDFR